jgi:hypothetical protein
MKGKPNNTRALMDLFFAEILALEKYFVSESKFIDPKNAPEITAHLKRFSELAKDAVHDPQLAQENFRFSRQVLQDHIAETERVYRLGNKYYARWMMNSTLSVCMSCHTQLPTASRRFEQLGAATVFPSQFEKAEFLFATRAFDKGSEIYNNIIIGYPANKVPIDQVDKAMERQLAYFTRIKRSPTEGIAVLEKYQKAKNLPPYLQKNIAAWIEQFKTWKKEGDGIDPKTASDEQVLSFAKKNLKSELTPTMMKAANPLLVTYLRISGILYEYLQTHPNSKAKPQVLYWLAICDRALNNNFFYSLADMYLRECIVQYPADTIAKKCYKEYEAETILGYSGSSGTHLPPDVRSDLDNLKKLVESGGKVEMHSR